jgi:hypothetical protein
MVEKPVEAGRLRWRLPLCTGIVGFAVFVTMALSDPNISYFWDTFVVLPILLLISLTLIVLLIRAAFGYGHVQFLPLLATLAVLWAIPASFFFYDRQYPVALRETARWLVWSHDYKNEVLAQPTSTSGDLKHIEWDGWGFPGAGNTTVFLVFDPTDSLSTAAKNHQSGKFNGIPCEVFRVSRLESHWYTVIYYTGPYNWDKC